MPDSSTHNHDDLSINLKDSQPFNHIWPHDETEVCEDYVSHFHEGKFGTAEYRGATYRVKVGVTEWEGMGAIRRRVVVFIEGVPILIFTGANDFINSHLMASVIKINHRQVYDVRSLPTSYEGLRIERFRLHVDGPRASHGLAVICTKNDYRTMIATALIRYRSHPGLRLSR